MRIGLFTDGYLPYLGGVETAVWNYQRALQARGHTVVVVCPAYPNHNETEPDVLCLKSFSSAVSGPRPQVWASRRNKTLVAAQQFDIVHVHTEEGVGLLGAWYAREHRVPCFQTLHTDIEWLATNFTLFSLYVRAWFARVWFTWQARRLGLTVAIRLAVEPAQHWQIRMWQYVLLMVPYDHRIFTPSAYIAAELQKYYPSKPCAVVFNAINTAEYRPEFSPTDAPIHILWVARAAPEKRPLAFLEAIRLLGQETEAPFTVDVVGGGPELKAMRRFVIRHKLQCVTLHGSLPRETVRKFYARADVFVMNSYHFDTQAIVMDEAMASGLPIVMCDERLADRVAPTGRFLASSPEPVDLATALQSALRKKTPESTKPIIRFATEHYSLDVLADRLERFYKA